MGILTDAFIASEEELPALRPGIGGPAVLFPTVQAKRDDPLKLATLEAIVARRGFDGRPQGDTVHLISDWEEGCLIRDWGEQWVYRFPESLVSALAQLQPSEIAPVATAWAATEEWRLDGIPSATDQRVEGLVHLVGEYRRLAQQAQHEGKTMYMWISL